MLYYPFQIPEPTLINCYSEDICNYDPTRLELKVNPIREPIPQWGQWDLNPAGKWVQSHYFIKYSQEYHIMLLTSIQFQFATLAVQSSTQRLQLTWFLHCLSMNEGIMWNVSCFWQENQAIIGSIFARLVMTSQK